MMLDKDFVVNNWFPAKIKIRSKNALLGIFEEVYIKQSDIFQVFNLKSVSSLSWKMKKITTTTKQSKTKMYWF